ncbi:uncharacterized protein TNCV_1686781 [Trichonephila clavipes]|nr:uncharacterized protein TNCV_1686781 [Trichonephila clavipes]
MHRDLTGLRISITDMKVNLQQGCTFQSLNPNSLKGESPSNAVSWVRERDSRILAMEKCTYTTDPRFSSIHLDNSDDWTLEIRDTREDDSGIYECQANAEPKMSLEIQLNIIGEYLFHLPS